MISSIFKYLLIALSFSLTGCALLVNGTKQHVTIHSFPQGAQVKAGERVLGTTPLSCKLSPRWQSVLTFSLPDSGLKRTTKLDTKFQQGWWIAADAPFNIFWLNIPMAVDLVSGAPLRFKKDTVLMDFTRPYTPYINYRDVSDPEMLRKADSIRAVNEQRRYANRLVHDSLRYLRMEMQRLKDSTAKANSKVRRDSTEAQRKRITGQLPNIVSLQLTALFIRNIELSYERRIVQGTYLGVTAGYKPRTGSAPYSNHNMFDVDGPVRENMLMPFAESYYISFNMKQFVYRSFYLGIDFFGRFTNYDNAVVKWEGLTGYGHGEAYQTSDSVKANITSYGFKIMPGIRKIVSLNNHLGVVLEAYCGLSFRVRNEELFHYQMKTNNYQSYPPDPKPVTNFGEYNTAYDIAPQLGFKMGLIF